METLFKRLEAFRTQKPKRKSAKEQPPLPAVPFVGRADELESLLESIRLATQGHGCFLFVSGDPGSGKSRLLSEVLRKLRGKGIRGFLVQPADHALPFSLFGQLLRDMTKVFFAGGRAPEGIYGAAEALVSGDGQKPIESPEIVEGSLRAFLTAVSRISPVAVLIDDFHHVDPQSLSALLFLARVMNTAPERPRLAFVAAFRPDDLAFWTRRARCSPRWSHSTASRCSCRRSLTRRSSGSCRRRSPSTRSTLGLAPIAWEQSHGNPFAQTLLDVMKSDATLAVVGKTVQLMSDRPPELPPRWSTSCRESSRP
ncbi:MAG: ATP-binding protein [Acidobacteriota bacterium]